MPLLKRERDFFPEDLFGPDSPEPWVVADFRGRGEKGLGVVLREKVSESLLVSVSLLRKTAAAALGREGLAPVPPPATASPSAGALTA
jgi:hypothetical protein